MADQRGLEVQKILGKAVLDEREPWPKEMKIWPSDLGVALGPEFGGCPVEFYHKCRDAPRKPINPGQALMFSQGDYLEDQVVGLMRKYLPQHGWVVRSTQARHKEFGISGRSDVVIEEVSTGYTIVVDVKTKRGAAFQYLNEPKESNVLQVQFYVAEADADAGMLVYVDREGQNFMRVFMVERADERPEKAVEVLTEIRDADEPPPTLDLTISRRKNQGADSVYLKTPWQMNWCSLKTCVCKAALPKSPPGGIVAKVSNDGLVTATKGNDAWLPTVLALLRQQYPDEDLYAEGNLFEEEKADAGS